MSHGEPQYYVVGMAAGSKEHSPLAGYSANSTHHPPIPTRPYRDDHHHHEVDETPCLVKVDICGCRKLWSRSSGFALAVIMIFLGAVNVGFNLLYHKPKYDKTMDFIGGTCETTSTSVEDRYEFRCVAADCTGKCRNPGESYICNKVMGKIRYAYGNYSHTVQIYANTDLLEGRMGSCSYKPKISCKHETETLFMSVGALDAREFRCYYSPDKPLQVVLKRNTEVVKAQYAYPISLISGGVLLGFLVKFLGHCCWCPSKSQKEKRREDMPMEAVSPHHHV